MEAIKPEFIIDDVGTRKAVIINWERFGELMKYVEELEDALELKKAIEEGGEFVELKDFLARMKAEGKI